MRKSLMFGLFLVMLGALVVVGLAQEPVQSVLAEARAAAQKYPNEDAVYLRNDESFKVDREGNYYVTHHYTILLLTQDGADDYTEVQFQYFSSTQTASVDYARTITMDGVVTQLDSSSIKRTPVAQLIDPVWTIVPKQVNAMGITFDMPNACVNTVIDYQVTAHGGVASTLAGSSEIWDLAQEVPVQEARLLVSVPREVPFKWKVEGMKLLPDVQTKSATVNYTFSAKDMPALSSSVNDLNIWAVSPRVTVSDIESWDRVAVYLNKLFSEAETVDESIRSQVAELTADCRTNQDKLDAIYRFMHHEILPFPIDHQRPLPAPMTLSLMQGDCKDQAALMITMLRLVGIEAYPVMIDARPGEDIPASVPYIANHIIVAVPQGDGWRFFDPSADALYAPDYLPFGDRDKHGILILGEKDRLWTEVKTPKIDADDTIIRTNAQYTLSANGDLSAHLSTEVAGERAYYMRYVILMDDDDVIPTFKYSLMTTLLPGEKLHKFSVTHSEILPVSDPFVVDLDFTQTHFLHASGSKLWFTLPYTPPHINWGYLIRGSCMLKREYSYVIFPQLCEFNAVVTVPASFTVELPQDVDLTNSVGSVHIQHFLDRSGKIVVDRVLKIEEPIITPARFSDLWALFVKLAEDTRAKIYLVQ